MKAVYSQPSGKVMFMIDGPAEVPEGYFFVDIPENFQYTDGDILIVSDGTIANFGSKPSPAHVWNWANKQWIYDIIEDQTQTWSRIKSIREAVEFGFFESNGHTFDGDSESRSRIQGAAQLAMLAQSTAQPFSIDWTLADNTQVTLTAAEMIGVGVSLGQHVNNAHSIARVLRAQIEAATTPEELETIQWPT